MRILIVNGHLHVGGVEKSLINLLRSLDYTKYQVDLLLVEDLGDYLNEVPKAVRIIYRDLKPTYGAFFDVLARAAREGRWDTFSHKLSLTIAAKKDKRALRMLLPRELRQEYDAAIAYRVGLPLDLVAYAVRAKKKLAWWHHGEFDYPAATVKTWHRGFEQMDRIVCVSDSVRKMITPNFPGLENRMCVVPNMIIPEEIRAAAEAFQPYAGVQGKTILVSVGRMSEEKHMMVTVYAMRELKRRGIDNLVWYLVGDGVQRPAIEQRIRDYGLQDCFVLTGNLANPYPYMKNADLFVHPSQVESQGICVLEAMALHNKCVVVRSSGIEEFSVDGRNALLAEQTIESLCDGIERALRLEKESGLEDGQEIAVKRYSPDTVVSEFNRLLREMV